MANKLRNYIKSLNPQKKQKIYNLRRETRSSKLSYIKLRKYKNCYKIVDLNDTPICIIPKCNKSMIKTYFLVRILATGFDDYLSDTFNSDYFFHDKRFNSKKTLFNKDLNIDDIDFISGFFPC